MRAPPVRPLRCANTRGARRSARASCHARAPRSSARAPGCGRGRRNSGDSCAGAAAARPFKKALGPLGYAAAALITGLKGLRTPGAKLHIRVDDEVLPRKSPVIQVAVGNGRFVGGGAALLPQADPSDGQLDVAVSYTDSPMRRIAYARSVRRGDHHRRDDVVYLRGTTVSVVGDALRCTSDGELTAPQREHTWRIEPSALTLHVP